MKNMEELKAAAQAGSSISDKQNGTLVLIISHCRVVESVCAYMKIDVLIHSNIQLLCSATNVANITVAWEFINQENFLKKIDSLFFLWKKWILYALSCLPFVRSIWYSNVFIANMFELFQSPDAISFENQI